MTNDTRLEIRLPSWRKAELSELATRAGLSLSDLSRMGLQWVVDQRDVLLGLPSPQAQIDASRQQLADSAAALKKLTRTRVERFKAKDVTAVKKLDAEIAEIQRGATLTARLLAVLQHSEGA